MARLLSLALIIGLLPSGLAGPACAQKYKTASDCISRCNQKWGIPGLMMGTDPWGTVMHGTGNSEDDWNNYIANACGQPENATSTADASSSSSAPASTATGLVKALGTQPGAVSTISSSSSSISTSTASSTSSSSSTHSTTSTTTSHTTSTTPATTSTKPTTTSTSTQAKQTTTQAQPTTTHTTAQAQNTQNTQNTQSSQSQSQSNSNSNSNSNGGGSSSSGGAGSNASPADQQAYLDAHNSIRSQHGAVPVTWSNAAAAKAQQWANECTNTHSGGTLGPLGENLAAGTGSFSIAQAVKAWTDEVSEYNPNNPQPSHFTQVVWKATTEIGCAVQTCDGIFSGFGAAQYYVCEYSVQGNVIGNFAANVQV